MLPFNFPFLAFVGDSVGSNARPLSSTGSNAGLQGRKTEADSFVLGFGGFEVGELESVARRIAEPVSCMVS